MMKRTVIVLLLLSIFLFVGCAAGPNSQTGTPDDAGKIAGFWKGLWHGFILLFTFIISLFKDSVQVYEVHNNGAWYNFGFLLGASIFFGGGCRGAGCSKKK